MRAILSAAQIRARENDLMADVPEGALMQRAAFGLSVICAQVLVQTRGRVVGSRICVLAGSGGNGGDALWAASLLAARGCSVRIVKLGDRIHAEGMAAALRAGGRVVASVPDDCDLILDGIVGIGGTGPLRDVAARAVVQAKDSGALMVSVDIPSGVDADSGIARPGAVVADVTVTFGALKLGVVANPGYAGHVEFVDIGLNQSMPSGWVMQAGDVAGFVGGPDLIDYKYSRGVAGIAAGSQDYRGAGLLCVLGARHADIGMVQVLDRRDGVAPLVVDHCPDVVISGADPSDQTRVSAWACGPGFAGGPEDESAVSAILRTDVPVVLDAGALTVAAHSRSVQALIADRWARGAFTVVTPHEGEFARLADSVGAAHIGDVGRLAAARDLATRLSCAVLFKGPGSIITSPTGELWIDMEGTEALGTAGSGDVLAGILAAVLAGAWVRDERDDLLMAVVAGVWLHGCAGRLAPSPATAVDIAGCVGDAVQAARLAAS